MGIDYERLLGRLWLASQLGSPSLNREFEKQLGDLEQQCVTELGRVKAARDAAEEEKIQLRNQLQQITAEKENIEREVKRLQKKLQGIEMVLRGVIGALTMSILIVAVPNWIARLNTATPPPVSPSTQATSPTPTSTRISAPLPNLCSDITISGLIFNPIADTGSPTIVSPRQPFTTAITSFSLRPEITPEEFSSDCEFQWSALYGDKVIEFNDTQFTSGEQEAILKDSKCHLVLDVVPFDKLQQAIVGNSISFEVVINPCPYDLSQ